MLALLLAPLLLFRGNVAMVEDVYRAVLDLPWRGHAPYHLLTTSTTVLGRRGTTVKVPLACTPSGCLDGYRPALHSWPMPKPVHGLSGLTRAQLESSMREVVAGQRWPSVRAVRCASLASCIVTLVTPGFPKQPYRVRYAIAGQQIPGCWLAWSGPLLDPLPYPDAGRSPLGLAGCRDWLR